MDSISEQPSAGAIGVEDYYKATIKEQNEQLYKLYQRVMDLAEEKSRLVAQVERLSKLNKFE